MRKIVSSLILAVLCWTVNAHPVRAVDGDTVDVLVETWIGFGSRPVLTPERIRVLGVNTPERGQPGFQEASDYSEAWLMKLPRSRFLALLDEQASIGRSVAEVLVARLREAQAINHAKQ